MHSQPSLSKSFLVIKCHSANLYNNPHTIVFIVIVILPLAVPIERRITFNGLKVSRTVLPWRPTLPSRHLQSLRTRAIDRYDA